MSRRMLGISGKAGTAVETHLFRAVRAAVAGFSIWMGAYWIAPDGRFLYVSPACEQVTGYAPEEFFDRPQLIGEIVHPEDREAFEGYFAKVGEGSGPELMEYRIVAKSGEVRWISHSCGPMYTPEGEYAGRRGTNRNITQRRKAEERTSLLASFPELNPNPVMEVDAAGAFTFCNPGALAILRDLGIASGDCSPFLPDDIGAVLRDWNGKDESVFDREVRIKDRVFAEAVHLVPQFGVARIYALDITGRRKAEEALRRQSRALRRRARVARARAHDAARIGQQGAGGLFVLRFPRPARPAPPHKRLR